VRRDSVPAKVVRWFESGLQQLHDAKILDCYIDGLLANREKRVARPLPSGASATLAGSLDLDAPNVVVGPNGR
jgi:aminoglycoside phosphotransferase